MAPTSGSAAENALLSELCTICHLNLPKYKCPQCAIRTCSLACVKRHKAWSQCSGTRDPAAYKKRHQLATPSSIDQDFNFITRVERTIERAGHRAHERGIALNDQTRKRVKGEARRDVEIQGRAALVLRAPPGMSRALQNKSKWDSRHKCLLWTVEWILENEAKVYGNCQETRTITQAFANAVGRRNVPRHQGSTSQTITSIRDRDDIKSTTEHQEKGNGGQNQSASHPEDHHFYLHRPNLPSNVRCVIPVEPDAMIKDIIRDRVLIEFPTIFVLTHSKHTLPTPFITEEEYLKLQHGGAGPPRLPSDISEDHVVADDKGQEDDPDGLKSPLNVEMK